MIANELYYYLVIISKNKMFNSVNMSIQDHEQQQLVEVFSEFRENLLAYYNILK